MKKIIIVTVLLLAGLASASTFLDSSNTNQAETESVVKTEQVVTKLSAEIKQVNGQLIDVREPSEYLESHAADAVNIPLGDILKSDFSKIDNSRPIYLICRSGRRAEEAKLFLERSGFLNVKNIGGLIDWTNQGNTACSSSTPICS